MELGPERQLSIRIRRLTIFRGVVIGMFGIFTSLWVYHFIQRFFPWKPVPFPFEGPLGVLYIMLCGITIVLQGEVTSLRSQLLALSRKRSNSWNPRSFSKHFSRLLGSFLVVLGFILLIWQLLKFPDPVISNAQQTSVPLFLSFIFLGILLCIGAMSWCLSLRDKHHVAQREQEGKSLEKDI